MCRLALQLLGMLGNVLGMLGNVLGMLCNVLGMLATSLAVLSMLCNVLGMLTTSLADLGMLLQDPKSPTSKRNPPTYCLISYEAKGVVYHQVSYRFPQ